MRDTAHQGDVKAHRYLQDSVQTMDINLKNQEEGNKVYDDHFSFLIQVPVLPLQKYAKETLKQWFPKTPS